MLRVKINTDKITPAHLKIIAGALLAGQVLVLPTDTLYGLSCLASQARAVRRINQLKGRSQNAPLLILVANLEMLRRYAQLSPAQAAYIKKSLKTSQRPSSFILSGKGKLAAGVAAADGSLALRLPKSKFLIKILETIKEPLVSTSLNRSGQVPLRSLQRLEQYFSVATQPDLAVDAGYNPRRRSSRLLDLRSMDNILVLRK